MWRKGYEEKIIKEMWERLWKKDLETNIFIKGLWRKDCEKEIKKTDYEWNIELGSLRRCGSSFLTIFSHFCPPKNCEKDIVKERLSKKDCWRNIVKERWWKKDGERKIVKERLWKKAGERKLVKESIGKKDCERKIV